MSKRVRIRRLKKVSDSASEIGFRETHLRLEGLREHIQQFRELDEERKPAKAQWLMQKIECSKPAIKNELYDRDAAGFFYWRKESHFRSKAVTGIRLYILSGPLILLLPRFLERSDSIKYGLMAAGLSMLATSAFMIANTIKNKRSSFSRFVANVNNALHEAENTIKRYLEERQIDAA